MKVKDLIKFLEKCDQNAECVIPTYTGCSNHLIPLSEAQEYEKGSTILQDLWCDPNVYFTKNGAAGRKIIILKT